MAQCKKIARSHRHASTAGMGALTRTAIGIINKTEDAEKTENKEGKKETERRRKQDNKGVRGQMRR